MRYAFQDEQYLYAALDYMGVRDFAAWVLGGEQLTGVVCVFFHLRQHISLLPTDA